MIYHQDTYLVVIGGAEDKTADKVILKKLVSLTKKKDPKFVVMTTATEKPREAGQQYIKVFKTLGVERTTVLNIENREDANREEILKEMMEGNCIFFTGGDQLRISSILGGTRVHDLLHKCVGEGKVIAGTSAGASMMSEIMVVEGIDGEAPSRCTIKMAPGMGLMEGVIIDQHFNQRGRIGRLLSAIAQNPHSLGIGIDENTAIVVNDQNVFEVLGSGVVTIIDGRDIAFTNTCEQYPNEPLAITNVRMHVLPTNYGYHLISKTPIIPNKSNKKAQDQSQEESK
ncbi:cyanophycinase [Anaerosolibacter carboniphilus]|uniref:Cyanophycinase n=1 Tax=Anaerosolibacter carboniphilus TaxID=1417629 RepID=A0A841KS94_9FIRM|nr:cyanophycinase [Anaerosolibacter carboniphilus]MBB6216297.1 cyanophycinase [Anaerosolibacter carboniphilus]